MFASDENMMSLLISCSFSFTNERHIISLIPTQFLPWTRALVAWWSYVILPSYLTLNANGQEKSAFGIHYPEVRKFYNRLTYRSVPCSTA
jgi:hypothetical protein